MTPNGLWQAYYLDKQRLIKLAQVQPTASIAEAAIELHPAEPDKARVPTESEIDLARQCLAENDGRLTEKWLRETGFSQDGARLLKATWEREGWAEKDQAALGKPSVIAVAFRTHVARTSDRPENVPVDRVATETTEAHG